jgi:hypothetical protein
MSMSFTGLTPLQINVLQVAIDHMEEHLADVASTGSTGADWRRCADVSEGSVEDLEETVQILQRLIAAKQIKEELRLWRRFRMPPPTEEGVKS